MKKLTLYVLLIAILFSSFIVPISAKETIQRGMIDTPDNRGVHVRLGPGTSYGMASVGLDDGDYATILGEEATNDGTTGCSSGKWYKIQYSTSLGYGYVCSSFLVNIEMIEIPDYNYEEELSKFPASFRPYIEQLHKIYPNASFIATYSTNRNTTKMDFNTAIDNENVLGKNLLWDSNGSRDGLKSINTYLYDSNAFRNDFSGGGKNWYAASRETIAYYLDARNFLNEKNIFMFESLTYNAGHSVNGVESILNGTFMHNTYVDKGVTNKKFSNVILEAGKVSGVGAYFLASRMKQEMGSKRNDLVYGVYPNYPQFNGYYNFFNIGATGEIGKIQFNGLNRAFQEGWDSEEKSIIGGSTFVGNDYILKGQNTQYFQKWDIQCSNKNSCFSHQYMQNLEAPYNEGISSYNAYKNTLGSGMYLEPFIFIIPVYENMPTTPSAKPSEASPIAYLSRLVVNGSSIANFSGLTTEYNIIVPAGTTSIAIEASAMASNKGATVKGTGNVAITSDKQDVVVTGVAANGSTLKYTIHVNRLKPGESDMTLEATLKSIKGATIKENYISGLTSVDTMRKAIVDANPAALVEIKNIDGKVITSGNLGTGYTVNITVGNETKSLEFILFGDTNGDGEITILDLLRIQKQLLKALNLNGSQHQSCDVNKDGTVDILDLLLVQKHLLGEKYINQ